jgi:hypothetical protein
MIVQTTPEMTPEEAIAEAQAEADAAYRAEVSAEMQTKIKDAAGSLVRLGLIFFGATAILAVARRRLA